jgi:GWxTD domain-containing protein
MSSLGLPLALAAGLWAAPLAAQGGRAVDSLLALRDTTGALLALEQHLKQNVRDTEAHYRAGQLYMSRHVVGSELSPNRRKAEEHFRYATRFAPDSAKYWLALADLFRTEDIVTTRAQVRGLLERARKAAEASGASAELAAAMYRQARADWARYEFLGHRYRTVDPSRALVHPGIDATWKEVEQHFQQTIVPIPGSGAEELGRVEEALWAVLRAEPLNVDAAGLLLVALGELDRWEEGAALTRRMVRAAPDSGRVWALHGLALARTHRWREALAAFDTGLARMPEAERALFGDLGRIMRAADRLQVARLPAAERGRLDTLYWSIAQPLALAQTNEIRTEFYARIVYATHRWSDPWRGYRGVETDMGTVFVAYGPPDVWTSDAWLYVPARMLFTFSLQRGFSRARFGGNSRETLRAAQVRSPARFDNIPLVRSLDTILVQTARFRAAADSTAVVVMGAIPLQRMTDSAAVRDLALVSGALVTDGRGREIQRDRRDETVRGASAEELQYRTWRLTLRPGDYLLRVEAHLPTLERGARSMGTFDVRPLPRDRLALSDLLVTQQITPRDSGATRWSQFLFAPNAGRFAPGDPVGILWEIYNLTPDSTGFTRYEVGLWLSVEAIDRSGAGWFPTVLGAIADKMGLTAVYDDRVSIGYTQEQPATPDSARAEHLVVDLRDAPKGRLRVDVVIRDLVTGQEATASRTITIGDEPVRR